MLQQQKQLVGGYSLSTRHTCHCLSIIATLGHCIGCRNYLLSQTWSHGLSIHSKHFVQKHSILASPSIAQVPSMCNIYHKASGRSLDAKCWQLHQARLSGIDLPLDVYTPCLCTHITASISTSSAPCLCLSWTTLSSYQHCCSPYLELAQQRAWC